MAKKPVISATISPPPGKKPTSLVKRILSIAGVIFGLCVVCGVFATVYNATPQGRAANATRTAEALIAEVEVPTVAVNSLAEQEETEPTNTPRPTSTGRVASSTTEELPTQAPIPTIEQPTEVPPTDVPAPLPTDIPPTFAPEPTTPPAPPTEVPVIPTDVPPPPTEIPVPTEVPAPAPGALVVVAVNKDAEWAEIANQGGETVDLAGWILRSERGNQECFLGGAIAAGQRLRIYALSGPDGFSCNFGDNIWNNSEDDDAVLINPQGQEVSRYNS